MSRLTLPTEEVSREAFGVASKDERSELKMWLTAILPEGMSREDVADELGVTRKTISNMLNPAQPGFGNGLTMLRYLRLAGAVADAPEESPATSRLAVVEALVAAQGEATAKSLDALARDVRALAQRLDREDGRARKAR